MTVLSGLWLVGPAWAFSSDGDDPVKTATEIEQEIAGEVIRVHLDRAAAMADVMSLRADAVDPVGDRPVMYYAGLKHVAPVLWAVAGIDEAA